MMPPGIELYVGLGAVTALLIWIVVRPTPGRHRVMWGVMFFLLALLPVVLILPSLERAFGFAVIQKIFFTLCGVALVTFIRVVWAALRAEHRNSRLLLSGLAVLLLLNVFFWLPSFVPARAAGSGSACRANLFQMQKAKEKWAADHNKTEADVPEDSDIFGPDRYIRVKPVCPAGGTYRLGAVGEATTCSVSMPSHAIDYNQ